MGSSLQFITDITNLITNTTFYGFIESLAGLAKAAGNLNSLLGLIK